MESKHKYGVLGAGAVRASLIGRLPSRARDLGPVCGVSYRVASRIANTLRAGYPVRGAEDLSGVPAVLVHGPPEYLENLTELLENAAIEWAGKAIIFCDCAVTAETRQRLAGRGASISAVREFGVPARLVAEGTEGPAFGAVQRMARDLQLKVVGIAPDAAELFDAAVTLGTAAITPLIDRAAGLLRDAGVRDTEAARMASSVFEQTARDYAHSGKQSWVWYARRPAVESLRAQIASAGPEAGAVLRELIRFGLDRFQKHGEVEEELAAAPANKKAGGNAAGVTTVNQRT